ncbi:MAG: hypothetical protein N3C63_10190 [Rhodocyclaceae bacterium]|nr:hypothetical protein [Rhodocyclaceae bacterium]
MRRHWLLGAWLCAASPAFAGEIIIVDPAREKAQSLPAPAASPRHEESRARALDEARARSGREAIAPRILLEGEPGAPAGERVREARGYLDESAVPPAPALIIKSGPPPSDASQAREKARAWVAPPAANNPSRCRTENTVGGIEGNVQGHTVIQGNASGVTICK